jgi:nucleoside-diphosphate-sugar epimerase
MRVLVTGATGLIGAHTTFELLKAGHQVRLLVRNREKAEKYFSSHGITLEDVVLGDMRDAAAVRQSLQGCDALVHAAAVVGVEKARAEEIYQSNLQAVRAVIDTAVEAGIANIVYVSSVGALCNDRKYVTTEVVDETARYIQSTDAYRQSKADCDRHVRALQAQGAAIQITYPTAVLGPDDPGMSESNNALRIFLTQMVPLTSSGFQIVDARDIAIAHRLMLERGAPKQREQGRYIVGGYFQYWRDLAKMYQSASGKWLFKFWLPDSVWIGIGMFLDHLKKIVPIDFPLTEEAGILVTRWVPVSSAKIERELGLVFRPTQVTVNDTAAWMRRAGYVK